MRVFKVDPKINTVDDYSLPDKGGKIKDKDIKEAVGCQWVQYVMVAPHVCLIVDEEGLRKHNYHWAFDNMQNYAGSGILCGHDAHTETLLPVPEHITKAEVLQHIFWLGDDQGLEKNIKRGLIQRPKQVLITDMTTNEQQTLWEWTPHEPSEERPNYNH